MTWNSGKTERFFARSALAPSKKKFVRWVAGGGFSRGLHEMATCRTCEMGRRVETAGWGGWRMQEPQLTLDLFCEVLHGSRVGESEGSPPLGESVVSVGQGGDDGGKRRGRGRSHFGRGDGDGTWEDAACYWASIPTAQLRCLIATGMGKIIQFLVTLLVIQVVRIKQRYRGHI